MDSIGENWEDFCWGLVLKQAFKESQDLDRLGRVRKCFAYGTLGRGQEREVGDAQERLGSWSVKYLRSELKGAVGQCSGVGQS